VLYCTVCVLVWLVHPTLYLYRYSRPDHIVVVVVVVVVAVVYLLWKLFLHPTVLVECVDNLYY
jgi:hypothetical protein